MMDTIDFASARQEVERELFGRTFEDDNMALDLLHANQNEELVAHELSVRSSSNYYPSQSLGIVNEIMHRPHLQQTFPTSESNISRNDANMSGFNSEIRSVNSVISLDNTQIELRPESIRSPRSSGILRKTKRVQFECHVTNAEGREGFIDIRPAKPTSRDLSQAMVEQRKR